MVAKGSGLSYLKLLMFTSVYLFLLILLNGFLVFSACARYFLFKLPKKQCFDHNDASNVKAIVL